MNEKPTCKTCQWWTATFSESSTVNVVPKGWGECRKHAPVGPVVYAYSTGKKVMQSIASAFVATPNDDWCGEHPDFNKDKP